MIDLCSLLGITVNELLCGERINMEDYKEKAEKTLVEVQKEQESTKRKIDRILAIIMMAAMIAFTGAYLITGRYLGASMVCLIGFIIL